MPQPPTFVRFRDLDGPALNVELQVHTTWTDGEGTIEEVLRAASERGLAAVAFTEHVRRETTWFGAFAAAVRAAEGAFPGRVYVGCEAKALDRHGSLDASEAILAECDLVLGSVHRFPDGDGGFLDFGALDEDTFARTEFELALGLLERAPIHVLAHPGGMYQRRVGAYPRRLFRELMEASLARGVAVEINASYLVDVDGFLDLCAEVNPYVSIGSDVHRLDQMGRCRDVLLDRRQAQPPKAP